MKCKAAHLRRQQNEALNNLPIDVKHDPQRKPSRKDAEGNDHTHITAARYGQFLRDGVGPMERLLRHTQFDGVAVISVARMHMENSQRGRCKTLRDQDQKKAQRPGAGGPRMTEHSRQGGKRERRRRVLKVVVTRAKAGRSASGGRRSRGGAMAGAGGQRRQQRRGRRRATCTRAHMLALSGG